MKHLMRFLFALGPALLLGVLAFLLSGGSGRLAALVAAATFYVGFDITRARPERGEIP
jgi:hypothetical protein